MQRLLCTDSQWCIIKVRFWSLYRNQKIEAGRGVLLLKVFTGEGYMSEELVGRIALLEQNCDENSAAIAGLLEEIERLKSSSETSSFEDPDPETISLWRKGSVLWYVVDKADPNIHHDIPGSCVRGRFLSLEVKESEYKGKPTKMLILHLKASKGSKPSKRIRIGAPGTTSVKTFCEQLSYVPDVALAGDLVFQVIEGKDEAAIAVKILSPETEQSFRPIPSYDSEEEKEKASAEGKRLWSHAPHWQRLLDQAFQRVNKATPTEPYAPEAPKQEPEKPVASEPISKPRPEIQDVEMSERRSEAAAARASAKVSREDAIAFAKRKFNKQASIEMSLSELNDFIGWLNIVEIVHVEMDRIGFAPDQEPEMVNHAGHLSRKKLESDRISALDISDLERILEWLGQMPDGSAVMETEA